MAHLGLGCLVIRALGLLEEAECPWEGAYRSMNSYDRGLCNATVPAL